jgi:acyl-CoA synthetase (AMP-forming)/AMP-acid ligase II
MTDGPAERPCEAAARALSDSPLSAAPAFLDRPAVFESTRAWTWRQIHQASIALSVRIAGASAVCNLCTSRLAFLVTCLAALRNRCVMILPPSISSADLQEVLSRHPHPVVVGDAATGHGADALRGLSAIPYVACGPAWPPAAYSADALAWQPAWDATSVVLFTSGSTGTPEPQAKTLRHLALGALVLGARLSKDLEGGLGAIERIVCSVPPQHMFGFECSVMLSLLCGMPVLDRRPLLPADVLAAFAGAARCAWIATPLHLRSLVQSGQSVRACSVVVTSTMPLAPGIARQAERQLDAPVLEIYGSTETGVLALRRTARETRWQGVDGVRVTRDDDANVATGSHFESPVKLLDELLLAADGSFTLLGRQSDLVKIAGRRASLAGLNLLLQEMPGLADGVFYLPDTGSDTERLCLIYAGPALDRTAALAWLRRRLDPVFLPRVFVRLERMPRTETGKMPRLLLDRAFADWQLAAAAPPRQRSRRAISATTAAFT